MSVENEYYEIISELSEVEELNESDFTNNFLNRFFEKQLSIIESIDTLAYYNLPFWWHIADDNIGTWVKNFPVKSMSKEDFTGYLLLYYLVIKKNYIGFSLLDFVCTRLKIIPNYMIIEYIKGNDNRIIWDSSNILRFQIGIDYLNLDNSFGDISSIFIEQDSFWSKENIQSIQNEISSIKFSEESLKNLNEFANKINNIDPDISWLKNGANKILDESLIVTKENINDINNEKLSYKKNLVKFAYLNKICFPNIHAIVFVVSRIFKDFNKETTEHKDISFGGLISAFRGNSGTTSIFDVNRPLFDELLIKITIKFREWATWQWAEKQKRELIKHSTKSAVAAIMGRNMSHNIGSHVLSILKADLQLKDDERVGDKNNKEISKAHLEGLSWFLMYLQERQDYVASVSGFENQTFIPVNFKEFVFDGLLPDKRALRHPNDFRFGIENVLLARITKSENLEYKSLRATDLSGKRELKVNFGDFDGINSGDSTDFKMMEKLNVSLPGGILGRQAFFSILENFIRNSAKHSPNDGNLEITISTPHLEYDLSKILFVDKSGSVKYCGNEWKFDRLDCEHILQSDDDRIELGTNIEKAFYSFNKNGIDNSLIEYDPKEFIQFTLSDNFKDFTDESLNNIQRGLNEPLINEKSGEINSSSKGLKEMRISAAWLRGIDVTRLQDTFNPPILQVRNSTTKDQSTHTKGSIEYVFYLLKPKELLIIVSANSYERIPDCIKNNRLMLSNQGIDIISDANIEEINSFRHSLNVFEADLLSVSIKSKLNQRIIELSFKEIMDVFSNISPDSTNEKLVESILDMFWEKRLDQKKSKDIYIVDDADHYNEIDQFETKAREFREKIVKNGFVWIHPTMNTQSSILEAKILFKKHNDNLTDYVMFREEYRPVFDRLAFLEGVSGGNSTQFLIRKLPKSKYMKNRILESCLQSILIIDERLWNRYSPNGLSIDDIDIKNEYKNDSGEIFQKKGISILNVKLIKSNKNEICFIDLFGNKYGKYGKDNGFEFEKKIMKNITILSIHQGIIDKIRDTFGNTDIELLEKLKNSIPQSIIKSVHSGRSKPENMDDYLGYLFIPYASLEAAFMDSKFMLTEMFFNLRK